MYKVLIMNILSDSTNLMNIKKNTNNNNSWGRNLTNKFSVIKIIKINDPADDYVDDPIDNSTDNPINDQLNNLVTDKQIGDDSDINNVVRNDVKLNSKWVLWAHDIDDTDWSTKSYKRVYTINTINDFWKLFNNFNKMGLKFMHYYIMRDDIIPTWEDLNNRYGGICSIKLELKNSLEAYEDLCSKMVMEIITTHEKDINGISISPKNNWALIKIWNKNEKHDLSKVMSDDIIDKYGHLSIKYKKNKPEY
jgi:hypothetical protein